jgi:hypothetical protein
MEWSSQDKKGGGLLNEYFFSENSLQMDLKSAGAANLLSFIL